MVQQHASRLDLEQALRRFPDDSAEIRRLFLANPRFRSVCEDYRLAGEALTGFLRRPDASARPEIEDYRRVLAELESEIATLVHANRAAG